jgi:hypothetical protein
MEKIFVIIEGILSCIGFVALLATLAIWVCEHFKLWDDQPTPEIEIEIDHELIERIQKSIEEEEQIF